MVKKVQSKTLGIAGLVFGILSFLPAIGLWSGVVAIGVSIFSLIRIRQNRAAGKWFAVAGIVLGILGIYFNIAMIRTFLGIMTAPSLDPTQPY